MKARKNRFDLNDIKKSPSSENKKRETNLV